MTTEAPVKVCSPVIKHVVACIVYGAANGNAPPLNVDIFCVSEAEIDLAMGRHADQILRKGLDVHLSDQKQRKKTRYNIALGKACGSYQPNE